MRTRKDFYIKMTEYGYIVIEKYVNKYGLVSGLFLGAFDTEQGANDYIDALVFEDSLKEFRKEGKRMKKYKKYIIFEDNMIYKRNDLTGGLFYEPFTKRENYQGVHVDNIDDSQVVVSFDDLNKIEWK